MSFRPHFRGGPGGFHGGGGGFGRFPGPGGGGMFPRRPMLGGPGLMGVAPRPPRFGRGHMPRGPPRFGGPPRPSFPPRENRNQPMPSETPKQDEPPAKKIKEEPKIESKEKNEETKKTEEKKTEETAKSDSPAKSNKEIKEEKPCTLQKTPESKVVSAAPSPKAEQPKVSEPQKPWQHPNRPIRPLGITSENVPSLLGNLPTTGPVDQRPNTQEKNRSWDRNLDNSRDRQDSHDHSTGGPPWSEPRKRPHPDNRDNRDFGRRQSFSGGRRQYDNNDGNDRGLIEPEIEPSAVCLDHYNSDLSLKIDPDCYAAESFTEPKGFCFCWSGARCTFGVTMGKVCFEVHITKHLKVDFGPEHKEDHPHVVRVGWSTDASSFQLGEEPDSYGFGGTGKVSENSKFRNYGQPFGEGDVITGMLDLTARPPNISYAKNGRWMGVAFPLRNWPVGQPNKALFPHILSKNCRFEVNFGQHEPLFPPPPGFRYIGHLQPHELVPGIRPPALKSDCEMIMMVGLPGVGKTTWAQNKAKEEPQKRYNIIGTDTLIDKMKVMGLPRKKNFHGRWENLIQMASTCLNKMFDTGSRRRRNFILDQTNVYATARRRKLKNFAGFQRKCAVLQPLDEEMERRSKQRTVKEGKYVPESAVLEMKKNFSLPEESDSWVDEIIFIELDRDACLPLLQMYHQQGGDGPGRTVFPKEMQTPERVHHPDRKPPWKRSEPEPWKRKQEEQSGSVAKQDKPWQQDQGRDNNADQRPPWQRQQDDRRPPWQRNPPEQKTETDDRERSPWRQGERRPPSHDRNDRFGRPDNRPAWQQDHQEKPRSWQQERQPEVKEERPWQQQSDKKLPWQRDQKEQRGPWQREGLQEPGRSMANPVKEESGSALDFIKNQYSEGRERSPSQEASWMDRPVKDEPLDADADRWGRQESRGAGRMPPSLFDKDTNRGMLGTGRGRGRGQDMQEPMGRRNDWFGGRSLQQGRDQETFTSGFPRDRFTSEQDKSNPTHEMYGAGANEYGNEKDQFGQGPGAGRGRGRQDNRFGERSKFGERGQYGHQNIDKDFYGRSEQDSSLGSDRGPGSRKENQYGFSQPKEEPASWDRWGSITDQEPSKNRFDSHGEFNQKGGTDPNRFGNQFDKPGMAGTGRGGFGRAGGQDSFRQHCNEGNRFGQGSAPAGIGRGIGAKDVPGSWNGGRDKSYGGQWGKEQETKPSNKSYHGQGDQESIGQGDQHRYYGGGQKSEEDYYGAQQSWNRQGQANNWKPTRNEGKEPNSSKWGQPSGSGKEAEESQYDWQGYGDQYGNYQWGDQSYQGQNQGHGQDAGKKGSGTAAWTGDSTQAGGNYGSAFVSGGQLGQYSWSQQQSENKMRMPEPSAEPKQERKRRSRWGEQAQEPAEIEAKVEASVAADNESSWQSAIPSDALLGSGVPKAVTPLQPPMSAGIKLPSTDGQMSAATLAASTAWQHHAMAATPWQYSQTPTSVGWPSLAGIPPPPPGQPAQWMAWPQPPIPQPPPPSIEKKTEVSAIADTLSKEKASKPEEGGWNNRPGLLGAFQDMAEPKDEPVTTGYEQLGVVDKTGAVLQPTLPATAGYAMGMGMPQAAAMPWGHPMGLGVGMRPVLGVPSVAAPPPGLPLLRGVAPPFPAVARWPPM